MIDVSPYVNTLHNKPVAVFGLARSGLSTIKALKASGAKIYAWDDNEEARQKAKELGATCEQLTTDILKKCAALVLAPGVPLNFPVPHPVVIAAREAEIEIISDIEIFGRVINTMKNPPQVIGITGTNGKSTTTALTAHTLSACGINAVSGGNIGLPVLELDIPPARGAVVLELSSYQLDLCEEFSAGIAAFLNVTPDHIDRHGDFAGYVASKLRIFKNAGKAVLSEELYNTYANNIPVDKTHIISPPSFVSGLENLATLRGAHNMENAAFAFSIAKELGCKDDDIKSALKTYPGLPHRQFPVRTINGVSYINDSKATNAEAAGKALASYENIFWIAGGVAKDGGLKGLERYMPHISHTFLIGEAEDEFADFIKKQNAPYTKCKTLDVAVYLAHKTAQAYLPHQNEEQNSVVLLSPACASFDQYKSYEERGDHFASLVNGLSGTGIGSSTENLEPQIASKQTLKERASS